MGRHTLQCREILKRPSYTSDRGSVTPVALPELLHPRLAQRRRHRAAVVPHCAGSLPQQVKAWWALNLLVPLLAPAKEAVSWQLQLLGLRPLEEQTVQAWLGSSRIQHRTMSLVRPPCRSSCKTETCSRGIDAGRWRTICLRPMGVTLAVTGVPRCLVVLTFLAIGTCGRWWQAARSETGQVTP